MNWNRFQLKPNELKYVPAPSSYSVNIGRATAGWYSSVMIHRSLQVSAVWLLCHNVVKYCTFTISLISGFGLWDRLTELRLCHTMWLWHCCAVEASLIKKKRPFTFIHALWETSEMHPFETYAPEKNHWTKPEFAKGPLKGWLNIIRSTPVTCWFNISM